MLAPGLFLALALPGPFWACQYFSQASRLVPDGVAWAPGGRAGGDESCVVWSPCCLTGTWGSCRRADSFYSDNCCVHVTLDKRLPFILRFSLLSELMNACGDMGGGDSCQGDRLGLACGSMWVGGTGARVSRVRLHHCAWEVR